MPGLVDLHFVLSPFHSTSHAGRRPNAAPRQRSENHVFDRRKQNARATGIAPDTMIDATSLCPHIVAGIELLLVDHELALKQIQLFDADMAVGRIVG